MKKEAFQSGTHRCPGWDGLLITPNDDEFACCNCKFGCRWIDKELQDRKAEINMRFIQYNGRTSRYVPDDKMLRLRAMKELSDESMAEEVEC